MPNKVFDQGLICGKCGVKYGKVPAVGKMSTWHEGSCDWCGETKPVTQSRDFNYPPLPEKAQA